MKHVSLHVPTQPQQNLYNIYIQQMDPDGIARSADRMQELITLAPSVPAEDELDLVTLSKLMLEGQLQSARISEWLPRHLPPYRASL